MYSWLVERRKRMLTLAWMVSIEMCGDAGRNGFWRMRIAAMKTSNILTVC